jgi:hypothetical protein
MKKLLDAEGKEIPVEGWIQLDYDDEGKLLKQVRVLDSKGQEVGKGKIVKEYE